MFHSIEKLSYWVTDKISKPDDEDKDYYQYAIHGILSFIVSSSFAVLLSIVFGYSFYIILIVPSVLFVRSKSGGSHANTARICFLWTNLMYLIIGLVSFYSWHLFHYSFIILFMLAICYGLTGLDDVPRYTKSATRHCDEKQMLFKRQYICRLIFFYVLITICSAITIYKVYNLSIISNILSMSIVVNRFSLSDTSFRILERLK